MKVKAFCPVCGEFDCHFVRTRKQAKKIKRSIKNNNYSKEYCTECSCNFIWD